MAEILETKVDKFTFKVATDRLYNPEGVWAKPEESRIRIGLADFPQQRSGDVAFAEVKPFGTHLAFGDEIAVIETIKVDISLSSPASGVVIETNPLMETVPEVINNDPYGEGWLALVEPLDWDADRTNLLDAPTYFELMKRQAEQERR